MNAKEKVALIQERLTNAYQPTFLNVIDESEAHIGHAGHQGGGRHFAIEITADSLKTLPRVAAHRKIYALFTDLIPDEIHALRIIISHSLK